MNIEIIKTIELKTIQTICICVSLLLITSCITSPYERGQYIADPLLKNEIIPLPKGTEFVVRQGAFGKSSHNEKGNEFQWDLEVPLGTDILSMDEGEVLYLYQPENPNGGPNPAYAKYAWGIHVVHNDGSVAQYLHVLGSVKVGQKIKNGDIIGKTVWLGWISYPHVHLGIYISKDQMYSSNKRKTLPIYFEVIENGILKEGQCYLVY